MSGIGDDPDEYTPGNQSDGSYYNAFPPDSTQPGLLGAQYAQMMANIPGLTSVDRATLGLNDFSGDGTGLPASVTIAPYLSQWTDLNSGSPDGAPPVDASFIARQEGGQRTAPYPVGSAKQFPNAGITIATGVDLGAHSTGDMKRWGVNDATTAKLQPYLGLKGQAALDALTAARNAKPGSIIDQADLDAMDRGVLNDTVARVREAYDAAGPPTPFDALDGRKQTAIVDLAYQFGTNLAKAAPKFWGAATAGDWGGAMNELNHFYGAKVTPSPHDIQRRKDEAGLLSGN